MPITIHWLPATIHWKCYGIVTADELRDAVVDQFYNDERSLNVDFEIFDYSEGEAMDVSHQDVLFYAATDIGRGLYKKDLTLFFVGTNPSFKEKTQAYTQALRRGNGFWEVLFVDTAEEALERIRQTSKSPRV